MIPALKPNFLTYRIDVTIEMLWRLSLDRQSCCSVNQESVSQWMRSQKTLGIQADGLRKIFSLQIFSEPSNVTERHVK